MKNEDHQLLVIGVGQMRTGTYSLKLALERLFDKKCYHMIELINNHQDHVDLWINAIDNRSIDKETSDRIFCNYFATTDYPGAIFYKDLIQIYPNVKVILTTRNSDDWLTSVRNTIMPRVHANGSFVSHPILTKKMPRFEELHIKMIRYAFQPFKELENDEILKRAYEVYNEEVRKNIPKERLLEFKINDGWKPLCRFLEIKEIPNEEFPFVNSTKEFNERFEKS